MNNNLDFLHPRLRNENGAVEFSQILAETIGCNPDDFGGEYAWDADIPTRETMQSEADKLRRHLISLGWELA